MKSTRSRFILVIYFLIIAVSAGIIGYMTIEHYNFLDALYMTVITLSTVGYEEVRSLTDAGQLFSIILIVFGVGTMLYALTMMVQYLLEGNLGNIWGRRRMRERIARLKDHIILCGYGLVGREVANVFNNEGVPFVIIEQDPQQLEQAVGNNYLCLEGNATDDNLLIEAGIMHAKALVSALATDADNVYVTLSAKGMRPDLFVVARASTSDSEPKLRQAGADRTMSPYAVGGRRLGMLTLRPALVDFVDTTLSSHSGELVLEDIKIYPGSQMCGKSVSEGRDHAGGTMILAVKKRDGRFVANPHANTRFEADDEMIVIGTREQLDVLEGYIAKRQPEGSVETT